MDCKEHQILRAGKRIGWRSGLPPYVEWRLKPVVPFGPHGRSLGTFILTYVNTLTWRAISWTTESKTT